MGTASQRRGWERAYTQPSCSLWNTGAVRARSCVVRLAFSALLLQHDPRIPTALGQEGLRVAHLYNIAQSPALVRGMLVVGLDDAIPHPVAEIALLFHG